jgi:mRNA-degrading endonuclease RelE of RelBE toxin-antitoxin system
MLHVRGVHRFALPYNSPVAEENLRYLTARQQAEVLDTVDEQLTHQPTVETSHRKPMRPNPVAPWELRIGDLRVYYDVEVEPEMVVLIRAVGLKEHNRVHIGGEVIDL